MGALSVLEQLRDDDRAAGRDGRTDSHRSDLGRHRRNAAADHAAEPCQGLEPGAAGHTGVRGLEARAHTLPGAEEERLDG